jgi:hypothetical protein
MKAINSRYLAYLLIPSMRLTVVAVAVVVLTYVLIVVVVVAVSPRTSLTNLYQSLAKTLIG